MKDGHDPFLQNRPEVDQHVTATNDVDARERRILKKVLSSENTHITDRFVNTIATFHFDKKASQPFRRNVGCDTLWVDPCAGFLNATLAEVSAKKLDGNIGPSISQELEQRNGLGVGLFAR
jgi:hypothetical protein